MKIAIEAQRIFRTKKHGMDFVILEALRVLQEIDKENQYRVYVADGEDRCLQSTPNFEIVILDSSNYFVFEQVSLPRAIKKWGPDILHCTSNTAPINVDTPLVLTLHDAIFLENYGSAGMSMYQKLGRLYRRFIVPRVLDKVKRIITVSKYEKEAICEITKIHASKISVVYNGVGKAFVPTPLTDEIRSKYSLPEEYIFFLGNTDPKKNAKRVIDAYLDYRSQNANPLSLVVADYPRELVEGMEGVIPVGYVCNSDLPQIYTGAEIFLYPSLRESFGIPMLEAMGCGTPVIASATSAMPEITSDAAFLINPTKQDEITSAMNSLLGDVNLRAHYREEGFVRKGSFSWEHTAEAMLKIYNEVHDA